MLRLGVLPRLVPLKFLDARKPSLLYKSHESRMLSKLDVQFAVVNSPAPSHFQQKQQTREARSKEPLSLGPWSPRWDIS